ncbi:MAG TPA: hypothetical protein V6D12_09360 [Candidatus Obscuribacterales bacterium]
MVIATVRGTPSATMRISRVPQWRVGQSAIANSWKANVELS